MFFRAWHLRHVSRALHRLRGYMFSDAFSLVSARLILETTENIICVNPYWGSSKTLVD